MSTPDTTTVPRSEAGSVVMFLIAASIATIALALAAAHAPDRIRLLGLYSLAFGLLLAWIQVRLASLLQVKVTTLVVIFVGLLTLAGLVGSACQTVALRPPEKLDSNFHFVAAAVEAQMRKDNPLQRPEAPPTFATRFQTYLFKRVELLGKWDSPWPETMWAGEILLGTVGAVVLAFKFREPKGAAT